MIIARSPLRISLGGGGTDLPSYYKKHGGFLLAAAIDKYVYATVLRPFSPGIYLKYSKIEHVNHINDVQHPIIREVLKEMKLDTPQIEITTLTDIPAGTGLGSSGSFTTALIKGLFTHYRREIHPKELAELACKIELENLKEPIGKQDQYIAAFGGITSFIFDKDGEVISENLKISTNTLHNLEDNLLLFFTGISRSASSILLDQDKRSINNDSEITKNLHYIKELGFRSRDALLAGDLENFGQLMNEHWEHKRIRSSGMTSDFIDDIYTKALQNGAVGGKLVGAGGGGFLMFYASDRSKLRAAMNKYNLEEVRFSFDYEGTKIILS
jgi:D-glycero-alpha-D-manno-heptose-7-phosphate kinase